MAYNLLPCDREQGYLMPPSLRDWLAEGELAWFVLDAIEQMDVGECSTLPIGRMVGGLPPTIRP